MDIVIYNEIRTVLTIYGTSLKYSETPKLVDWFSQMQGLQPIANLDNEFDKVCTNRNIGVRPINVSTN